MKDLGLRERRRAPLVLLVLTVVGLFTTKSMIGAMDQTGAETYEAVPISTRPTGQLDNLTEDRSRIKITSEVDEIVSKSYHSVEAGLAKNEEGSVKTQAETDPEGEGDGNEEFMSPKLPISALAEVEDIYKTAVDDIDQNELFIKPDFSSVSKKFAHLPRIQIDVPFYQFTDKYKLADPSFSSEQLRDLLREVSNVWIKGNIFVRFRIEDTNQKRPITDRAADVYKWMITGRTSPKNLFRKDINAMLVNGKSNFTAKEISTLSLKAVRNAGHDLLNWILGIGSQDMKSPPSFTYIYTVYYYKWYNGGRNGRRVFVRSGSCFGSEKKRFPDSGEEVVCPGWRQLNNETLHPAEFVRILSHEIGHSFQLGHPPGKCTIDNSIEEMRLMRQQKTITVVGHRPCGLNNDVAKFSRFITDGEFSAARRTAAKISKNQEEVYKKFPGLKTVRLSPSEQELAYLNAIVFPNP